MRTVAESSGNSPALARMPSVPKSFVVFRLQFVFGILRSDLPLADNRHVNIDGSQRLNVPIKRR